MSVKTEIDRLGVAKSNLKAAIEGKGVIVPEGTKLDGYGALVEQISSPHPPIGFVPEEWDEKGYVVRGTFYGTEVPDYYFSSGGYDFYGFPLSKGIKFNDDITRIGESAFEYIKTIKFENDQLPLSLKEVGMYAFSGCENLTFSELPDGLETIGNSAFNNCQNVTFSYIPESVTFLDWGTFRGCKKITINSVPKSITSIPEYVFNESSITDFSLHDNVTEIKAMAFSACSSLTTVLLSKNLQIIDTNAFKDCSMLSNVSDFPAALKTINYSAFKNCVSLKEIIFKGTPEHIEDDAFEGCTNLTSIKVPWSQGAVANAPWGAKSATITYDYTGG